MTRHRIKAFPSEPDLRATVHDDNTIRARQSLRKRIRLTSTSKAQPSRLHALAAVATPVLEIARPHCGVSSHPSSITRTLSSTTLIDSADIESVLNKSLEALSMAEDTPEGMASDSNVPGGILKRKWDEGKTAHGTKAGFSGVGHVADFSASGDSAFEGLPPAKRRKFTPKVQFEAGGSDVPVDVPQKRAVSDSLRERTVPLTIHRAQNDGKEPQPPLTIKIPPRRVARRYNLRAKPKASKRAAVQSSSKRNAQTKVNKPYSARPNTRVACPQYDTCQQTFARKGDATRHAIETHNGKRHECLGCRRWFSRADALHRHQRSKCGDVMRQRSN